MNKKKFLRKLKWQLRKLPREEVESTLEYYEELIGDHVEEGMSEEEAVAKIDPPEKIAQDLMLESGGKTKKPANGWKIAAICIGSIVWVPLLLVALVLILVMYLVLWVMVLVIAVLDLAMLVTALACLAGIGLAVYYKLFQMIPLCLGGMLVAAGLAVLLFFALIGAAKGVAKLGTSIIQGIVKSFRKEEK